MMPRRAVCLFVFFLHLCWVPSSISPMPPPELVWNVFRLATDEALIQERKNGVGGRSSAEQDPDHAEKFASPLPDYDIHPLGDVQGVAVDSRSINSLWVKGNVLLVLAENEYPQSSHLYRLSCDGSGNYSSSNISHLIGSWWKTVNFMELAAADDSVVFIVARDQQRAVNDHPVLFVSRDAGASWEKQAPLPTVLFDKGSLFFSPTRASDIIFFGHRNNIYCSKTYGKLWTKLASGVNGAGWDADYRAKTLNYIFYTKSDYSSNLGYSNTLYRVDAQLTKTEKIDDHLDGMIVRGRFVFTFKRNLSDPRNYTSLMYSSSDHGKTFSQAHIPAVGPDQFYVPMNMPKAGAFIQYKDGYVRNDGKLYASDSGGTFFSLSLSNHYYFSHADYHDFYEVKSVRGVYITSVLVEGKLQSRITFDNGGVWDSLTLSPKSWRPPSCKSHCQLNLHLAMSVDTHVLMNKVLMQRPISHATAPGLIVATGMFEPLDAAEADWMNIAVTSAGTYLVVSSDGGETWTVPKGLEGIPGYFLFGIFDYGNAIVVMESQVKYPRLWFSYDRGNSFQLKQVTSQPFIVRGFLPVPKTGGLVAATFGQSEITSPSWKLMFLDLKPFLHRPCVRTADYTSWTPKGNCILGQNITYTIAKPMSRCYNPDTFDYSSHSVVKCSCSYKVDFECVYGYERASNLSCVQSKNLNPSLLRRTLCPPGQDTYMKSVYGYRRVPGDMCSGGDEGLLKTVNKPCKELEEEAGYGYGGADISGKEEEEDKGEGTSDSDKDMLEPVF